MPAVEIVSAEETRVWNARQKEVQEHASYKTKQQYFPRNMDEWEEKGKEIEHRYRQELLSLNKQRKEEEKQKAIRQRTRKAVKIGKLTSITRHSLRQAARALMELKTPR
jgi:hypothetical protein